MTTLDIVICALKMEAKSTPNKKIFIGQKQMTYRALATKLEQKFTDKKKLPKSEDKFITNFVASSVKMFEMNPTFRTKMMELAGPDIS